MFSKELYKYTLKVYIFSIFSLFSLRIIFLLYHFSHDILLFDFFKALVIGFIFDSCVISSLILICYIFSLFFSFLRKKRQIIYIFIFFILTGYFIVVFINLSDIFYYEAYGIRLNLLATEFIKNFSIVYPMLNKSYPLTLIIVIFSLFIFIIIIINKKQIKKLLQETVQDKFYWFFIITGTYVASSFLYYGPPLWYLSNFSKSSVINQASLNGVYTLTKSFQQAAIYKRDIPHYKFMEDSIAIKNFQELIKSNEEKFISSLYPSLKEKIIKYDTLNTKNIVFIMLESFSSSYLGFNNQGQGFSPKFDSLIKNGIYFNNFYSNGPRTQNAIVSVIGSFPAILKTSLIRRKGINEFHTLGHIMADLGYTNTVVYGGDIEFDDMRMFFTNSGFKNIISEKDFKNWKFKNEWGVCDEDLFDAAGEVLKNKNKQFILILSLSNHAPFDIPPYFLNKYPELNKLDKKQALYFYTDYCLGKFIEKCSAQPVFSSTVFFIFGDHGEPYTSIDYEYNIFHVPLLVLNSNMPICVSNSFCSQIDLAPTVLKEIGYSGPSHFIGKELLSESEDYVIFQTIGGVVNMVKDSIIIQKLQTSDNFYYKKIKSNGKLEEIEYPFDEIYCYEFEKIFKSYLQSLSYIFINGRYRYK